MSPATSSLATRSADGGSMPLSERARHLLARTESPSELPSELLAGVRGQAPSMSASGKAASEVASEVASGAVCLGVLDALRRGETHYTDRPGLVALRVAVAAKLTRRFAIELDAEADLVITCGATEARFLAAQQLLRPGATLTAPAHGERVEGAALLRRAHLVTVTDANASVLYLASSMREADCRAAIAAAPATTSILYEIDESAGAFHPAHLAGCSERTTMVGGLGAEGWRIGYLASPRAESAGMRDFKLALTICSTSLSQWALLAALEAGEVAL